MAEYPKLYRNGTQIKILKRSAVEIYNVNRSSKRVYHKHTGTEAGGQGCYTVPVYHVHSGTAGLTYSNGCYTVPQEVSGGSVYCGEWVAGTGYCSGDCKDADGGDLGCPGIVDGAWCSGCGEFSAHCPGGYSHYNNSGSHTEYVPGCGKTPGVSIDKYSLGCGYEV